MSTPKYRNGFIPDRELVIIEGNHKATRGTAARWEALKADVRAREGVTLRITGGENAYRSFAGQTFARNNACARGRCNDAAVPGHSSHGGSLNGRDSGAIDVDNWAVLGKEKFYAYCRKHGFEPGFFSWEPWHIIDWAPYSVPGKPADSGSGAAEEEEMDVSVKVYVHKETNKLLLVDHLNMRIRNLGSDNNLERQKFERQVDQVILDKDWSAMFTGWPYVEQQNALAMVKA